METHICPSSCYLPFSLKIRKWIHNPEKIFSKYVKSGDSAIDIGCGPGFFTIGLAKIVGKQGLVLAVDVQEAGLQMISKKIKGTPLENIIQTHQSTIDSIGVTRQFDFILNFWMLHEVNDKEKFIGEIRAMMKPESSYMLVEPRIHLNKKIFFDECKMIEERGFRAIEFPKVRFSRAVVFVLY